MRDWTTTDYTNSLPISDLLQIETRNKREMVITLGDSVVRVRNITLVGTIVEVKDLSEKGYLYLVDDGTGVITCKFNSGHFEECLSMAQEGLAWSLNERHSRDSTRNETVFNDTSSQLDEEESVQSINLQGIQSIWQDVTSSLGNVIHGFQVGDNVCINGRIYMYFGIAQIYVNAMRKISVKEECVIIRLKTTSMRSGASSNAHCSTSASHQDRVTFDNVHHLEAVVINENLTPKRKAEEVNSGLRKRASLVSPHLDGAITFDTLVGSSQEEQLPTIHN